MKPETKPMTIEPTLLTAVVREWCRRDTLKALGEVSSILPALTVRELYLILRGDVVFVAKGDKFELADNPLNSLEDDGKGTETWFVSGPRVECTLVEGELVVSAREHGHAWPVSFSKGETLALLEMLARGLGKKLS